MNLLRQDNYRNVYKEWLKFRQQSRVLVSLPFSMILLTVKDKNYSRNMCILFCRRTQTRKHFQDIPSWYPLLYLAALNENITSQLRSFSLEDDS